MGDVVNLNRFRKRKAREDAAKVAEANRLKFGRTRAEKEQQSKQRARELERHDGNKLVRDPEAADD